MLSWEGIVIEITWGKTALLHCASWWTATACLHSNMSKIRAFIEKNSQYEIFFITWQFHWLSLRDQLTVQCQTMGLQTAVRITEMAPRESSRGQT